MSDYSEWFQGAAKGEFGSPQRVKFILPHIALTMHNPYHPYAYRDSCHQYAAHGMAYADKTGQIKDSDEILLLGVGDLVSHTIVVRPLENEVLIDRLNTRGFEGTFDFDKGEYRAKLAEGGIEKEPLTILHRISYGDFKSQYLSKIIAPKYEA